MKDQTLSCQEIGHSMRINTLLILTRALVSMGAVGALAPSFFESVGGSTHGFWGLLSQIHKLSQET